MEVSVNYTTAHAANSIVRQDRRLMESDMLDKDSHARPPGVTLWCNVELKGW